MAVAEIAIFDLETTIPSVKGETQEIIEFGVIFVDPCSWQETRSYTTLVHSKKITEKSVKCNHITLEMVANSPSFAEVAATIYQSLHNKVWMGHNLIGFDIPVLEKSFRLLNLDPPTPLCVIDTLPLLRKICKDRIKNFQLATFGLRYRLGEEQHRSIDDCRMNLDVMKNSALAHLVEQFGLIVSPDNTAHLTSKPRQTKQIKGIFFLLSFFLYYHFFFWIKFLTFSFFFFFLIHFSLILFRTKWRRSCNY